MPLRTTDALFTEVWIEYGISVAAILLRFLVRARIFGLRNFDLGDALAGLALVFYTLSTSSTYLVVKYGHNVGITSDTAMQVPDLLIPMMTLGSKLVFMNWFWYINLLWCLKGILLVVYVKMGFGVHRQELLVKAVCGFTIICWLASNLCHICRCTPIRKNWQIKPYPGDDCTLRPANYIVISILNATSDLAIIMVPMPLLLKIKVPLSRKITLMSLFAMGFFCIIATILRAYYSLHSIETLNVALGWASRELFVGTIVACAPGLKPLVSTTKWLRTSSIGSREKLSGARLSGLVASMAKGPEGRGDGGVITVSRSVDVYRTERDTSEDINVYELEMTKWRKHGTFSSTQSDEVVMMEEELEHVKSAEDGNRGGTYPAEKIVRPRDQV